MKAKIKRLKRDLTAVSEHAHENHKLHAVPSSYAVKGLRIVETEVLARGLDDGHVMCRTQLSFSNV